MAEIHQGSEVRCHLQNLIGAAKPEREENHFRFCSMADSGFRLQ